jgi:hypothetical protein
MAMAAMCAAAQTPAMFTVSGTIVDPSGASVPDAVVDLQHPPGQTVQSMRTGATGTFRFAEVAAASYLIRVQHEGFNSASLRLRIASRTGATRHQARTGGCLLGNLGGLRSAAGFDRDL